MTETLDKRSSEKGNQKTSGACLCGSVVYEIEGGMRPIIYCHCDQCRRSSGHYVAASACPPEKLILLKETNLVWFRSSEKAQRGFCSSCGSNLFWKSDAEDSISIMAGALDRPIDIKAEKHIFTPEVWDYYRINDGLPQFGANAQVRDYESQ